MKKCKKCGAPLEGFLYNTIGKLMGIKPSDKDPEICNKCSEEPASEPVAAPSPEIKSEPQVQEKPAEPAVQEEPKEAESETDSEPKL